MKIVEEIPLQPEQHPRSVIPPTPQVQQQESDESQTLKFFIQYAPSLILENKGATARDHLANERTYLSYLRTSLSIVTVGVAMTQLFQLDSGANSSNDKTGQILGSLFVAMGLLFLIFGASRYFFVQKLLTKGLFASSRGSVTVASMLLLFLTIGSFVITLLVA